MGRWDVVPLPRPHFCSDFPSAVAFWAFPPAAPGPYAEAGKRGLRGQREGGTHALVWCMQNVQVLNLILHLKRASLKVVSLLCFSKGFQRQQRSRKIFEIYDRWYNTSCYPPHLSVPGCAGWALSVHQLLKLERDPSHLETC